MARSFVINGESMVTVKGSTSQALIASVVQLGLAEGPIHIVPEFRHKDMNVDAWGSEIPADIQFMLAAVNISMNLIHYDALVLDACLSESMGGVPIGGAAGTANGGPGQLGRAGRPLGANSALFSADCRYVTVNILSPVFGLPWRFLHCYMTGPPVDLPLGTEKSVTQVNWRCIPYTTDPYGNGYNGTSVGTGAQGYVLWDNSVQS